MTFDGITELWFDDVAGLEAVFASERYNETIQSYVAEFLDLHACEFVLSTERVLTG